MRALFLVLLAVSAAACRSPAGPPVPQEPFVPPTDTGPVTTTPAPGACPALPALPEGAVEEQRRAAALAAALRRLACEPALYARSGAALTAELGLGAEAQVSFASSVGVRVEPSPPLSPSLLAAALGVVSPVVTLRMNTYHQEWYLGAPFPVGVTDRLRPGAIVVQIDHRAEGEPKDGTTIPLDPTMAMQGPIFVAQPSSAVTVADDPDGVRQLATAAALLAATPAMLALPPADVAQQLKLTGERFRVARTSLSRGDVSLDGISLDPQRTRIAADALMDAMGIHGADALCVNAEHGVWHVQVDGHTDIPWRGVQLEVEVDVPREGSCGTRSLHGLDVDFVSLLPGAALKLP